MYRVERKRICRRGESNGIRENARTTAILLGSIGAVGDGVVTSKSEASRASPCNIELGDFVGIGRPHNSRRGKYLCSDKGTMTGSNQE